MADGKAEVERLSGAGTADLSLGVNALATLYTGHLSPQAMAGLGLIEASATGLATATTLFAGPRPWLSDMF